MLSCSFYCFTNHSFLQMCPSIVFKGVFVVWKKVLVKRRAVNQSVCLLTIELSELMIQVTTAHFCTFDHSGRLFLISESIMRIIFLDKNGILYTQEKSEIL